MCDPVTLALTAVSIGTGLIGSISQGLDAQSAANYNARQANDAARQEETAARLEGDRIRREGRRAAGATRSSYGAAGVLVDTGSPAEVMEDDSAAVEVDALMVKYGGALRARSYRAEARQSRAAGSAAMAGGIFNAGATIATGGIDRYLAYNQPKAAPSTSQLLADPYPGKAGK